MNYSVTIWDFNNDITSLKFNDQKAKFSFSPKINPLDDIKHILAKKKLSIAGNHNCKKKNWINSVQSSLKSHPVAYNVPVRGVSREWNTEDQIQAFIETREYTIQTLYSTKWT